VILLGFRSTESRFATHQLQGDVVVRFDACRSTRFPLFATNNCRVCSAEQFLFTTWGRNATLRRNVDTRQLGLGKVIVERAKITLNGTDGQLSGDVRTVGHNSGTLELEAATPNEAGVVIELLPGVDVGVLRVRSGRNDFQPRVVSPFLTAFGQ